MRSIETLENHIGHLAGCLDRLKRQDLSLSQLMDEFTIALDSFRMIQENLSQETLDVVEMKTGDATTFEKHSFDWKNL